MDLYLETPPESEGEMSTQSSKDSVDALRKELDEALSRVSALESKLACQARERTELVHLVSHELRTPITVISGFGRLLQNEAHGTLNKEQIHYIDQSLKASPARVRHAAVGRDRGSGSARLDQGEAGIACASTRRARNQD